MLSLVAAAALSICAPGPRDNCVVDGDTFWLDGRKERIADIDTPETGEAKCASEYAQGMKATHRLHDLLNAGPFVLKPLPGRDQDKYGRDLRIVVRNGRSLGDQLVSEGLARTWTGRRAIYSPMPVWRLMVQCRARPRRWFNFSSLVPLTSTTVRKGGAAPS